MGNEMCVDSSSRKKALYPQPAGSRPLTSRTRKLNARVARGTRLERADRSALAALKLGSKVEVRDELGRWRVARLLAREGDFLVVERRGMVRDVAMTSRVVRPAAQTMARPVSARR